MEQWITFLLVGGVAGFLGGLVMKGRGFGLLGNIIVGILGGLLGGWLCQQLEVSLGDGMLGSILTALAGSVVLLFVISLVKKGSK